MDSAEKTAQEKRGCIAAFILSSITFFLFSSVPTPKDTFPTFPTQAGSQEWSGDHYLAGQNLSSDRAAYESLHVLPCLLFLHRGGCVEGDFHHGESLGCAVRRRSNQCPGLQVGREDRASPNNSYFLFRLPYAAASLGLGILVTQSQNGWETVGGPREGPREEWEEVQVLGWRGGCQSEWG